MPVASPAWKVPYNLQVSTMIQLTGTKA